MNERMKDSKPQNDAVTDARRGDSDARAAIDRALFPFMPSIYVAWSDGVLTSREIRAIRDRLRNEDWLDDASKRVLDRWLDPESPPSATALQGLLVKMREIGSALPEPQRISLVNLGLELARNGAPAGARRPDVRALQLLEDALGVVSEEAARGILGEDGVDGGAAPAIAEETSPLDALAINHILEPEHRDTRADVFALLSQKRFVVDPTWDDETYRTKVWEWCQVFASKGLGGVAYPKEYGGEGDVSKQIATFETLAYHDLSLTVKFGVQFGLFGGTVYLLGTKLHHDTYLRDIATAALPGCFAMTETGHGSNVRDLRTVARYEAATDEFVINTPDDEARKDYIGGAAMHARVAAVFAQLEVGSERHGVHAFLVPVRAASGQPMPGVRIADCGHKEGLNGVDNGRLWFDNVRIPRTNLLDRFGGVSKEGTYTSAITSPSRRFFTMLGTLVAGRISIAGAAVSAVKVGLTIAVRYAASRRQFGPEGGSEVPILSYRLVQRALLPKLAATYALHFAMKDVGRAFVSQKDEADARWVEVLAAGIKAYSSTHTVETLQACREACGGQGYMAENRFAALKADTDIFTTFEGANGVLLQLVAKGLLTDYRQQFGEIRLWSVVKLLANRAATVVTEMNPITTRRTDREHLLDAEFHVGALQFREQHLLGAAGRRLKKRIDEGMDSFEALNSVQSHVAVLANAHIERVIHESFVVALDDHEEATGTLEKLRQLFALSCIEADKGWFLESGYIDPPKSKAIRGAIEDLCEDISTSAVTLVDAFGIPESILKAPIAVRPASGKIVA